MPIRPNRALARYGEIALKGKNRPYFETAVRRNIEHRLMCAGLTWPVRGTHDGVYVKIPADSDHCLQDIVKNIAEIAGVASVSLAVWFSATETGHDLSHPDLGLIEKTVVELARAYFIPEAGFAVRVNRIDKRFPAPSNQLERRLGTAIIENSDWAKVNLNQPDRTFYLDIYPAGMAVYVEKIPGIRGLPIGVSGRVLNLLSGGIDSPVAAYLMAKRGCWVDFMHMTATMTQPTNVEENLVNQIARQISRFTLRSRLYLVPSTYLEVALLAEPTGYELILFRRFMARTAQALARRIGAQALVSGDSLGQVASQTLENMITNSLAVELPMLRPLLTYDKQEIIALARKIGTYETSIKPYKDCCALLSRHPKTKSYHAKVLEIENRVLPNYQELIESTLADAICLEYDCGEMASKHC